MLCVNVDLFGQYEEKAMTAVRCVEAPKINGELNDACWAAAPSTSGFIMDKPTPGVAFGFNTEVKIVYDDEAIYIAIMNYDPHPDSILTQLTGRDNDGNSDYCGITFSCYRDGINGLTFANTPYGEQYDARVSPSNEEDVTWNAVWYVKCQVNEHGWVSEYKIPFAALRFPDTPVQEWGINFFREVRRFRHHAFWRGVDPAKAGYLTQMGILRGIENIQAPSRFFLYPYASAYQNFSEKSSGGYIRESSWNAGMDVKIGLNDAFTLDATLVPDFGQVISDQQILNLSPFEVQFQDNRQFFIEGTELFSKAGIFYSRRIGYLPDSYSPLYNTQEGESYSKTPSQLQLLNASKISGRNSKGLGIGFFNAVTAKAEATVVDSLGNEKTVDYYPLTNYNVLVFDQNLKNNSFVSIINTNILRNGNTYDANVTGFQFDLRNKKNSYSLAGSGAYNVKMGGVYKQDEANDDGFTQQLSLSKISGKWTYSTGYYLESDTYDPTDMGFLQANNSIGYYASGAFRQFTPFGRFNSFNSNIYFNYNQLYNPNTFTDFSIETDSYLNTKKFTTYNLNTVISPVRGYDYFEPRTPGMTFRTYTYNQIGGWISTDYRKPIALDLGAWTSKYENEGRHIFNWRVAPRFRVNDHLFITYVYSKQQHFNDLGYATRDESSNPIFGRRDVISHTNVLTINYAFNPIMTASCRVRHYWGFSKYKEFYNLKEDGYLEPSTYVGFVNSNGEITDYSNADRSFNSFTVDLVYRWIFTPGSEISIVWKNAIINSDFGDPVPTNLGDDIDYTFRLPQSNSISLKVLYFLDYNSLVRKKG
jgi:hypothetical protein